MEDIPINTEKYSKIVSEIERFIEAKKEKPTTVKGIVEKIDLSNNILTVKLQSTEQPELSRGSIILIREDDLSGIDIRATVRDIYKSTLRLEIKSDPSQFENKKVAIDTNKTNVILERLRKVIENIKKGKTSLDNIRILDFIIGENKPQYSNKRISFVSKRLNKNQKEAVIKSIGADDFHLVIGPPGTGKTYIIEELIRQLSRRKKKLLITAWTNLAVDNIVKRLLEKETKKLVRIGPVGKVDPKVRKHSIFEKMKGHKDWKEVVRCQKVIGELYGKIPKVKDELNLIQESISQTKDKVEVLNRELDHHFNEKQRCEDMLSAPTINESSRDVSSVINEMGALSQKSETCLSLSKNILQANDLRVKIPPAEYIYKLKKARRNMRIYVLRKKVSSIFSRKKSGELEKTKQEYGKISKCMDEISGLQKKYQKLKKLCEKESDKVYPDGNGQPDRDALNSEFKICKILESEYLPVIKEHEKITMKRTLQEINKEVYMIYLESLKRKIDLLKVKRKGLNTELYIQINHKNKLDRQRENLFSSIDFYKKNVDRIVKAIISEIVNDAELIAATAVSSCHYYLDGVEFDVMIMDEASQVASFMSLLPLLKCKKFVLVGDNRQLQPIEEEDISKEMNLSIFNRLLEMYPEALTLLTIQYRMHKTIASIASEIFYEGKLITSEKVAERILSLKAGKHQFLNPAIPVAFIDTSKVEYYEDEVGSGCSNTKEAKYVSYIVSLFVKNGINTENIGVITPYVKQNILIREFLKDIQINDVEVDTVHKFQGREKDVIIMSFAKSKKYSFPQYKLRFVEMEELINVAITRAKKKLILVGNSKTLCQSKLLDKVVNKIGEENTIIL